MDQVLTSKNIQEQKEQVNALLKLEEFAKAKEVAQKLVDLLPNDPEANCLFALACLETYRVSDALEYANLSVKLAEKDPDSRYYRGVIQYRMGLYESALLDFDYVINLSPEFGAKALEYKTSCLAALKKYSDAFNNYDICFNVDPTIHERKPKLREWLKNLSGVKSSFLTKILSTGSDLLEEAQEAFSIGEYWYAEYAAEKILSESTDSERKSKAKLIQLQVLFAQFKIIAAKNLLKELHQSMPGDLSLIEMAVKIEAAEQQIPKEPEEEPIVKPVKSPENKGKRTDFESDPDEIVTNDDSSEFSTYGKENKNDETEKTSDYTLSEDPKPEGSKSDPPETKSIIELPADKEKKRKTEEKAAKAKPTETVGKKTGFEIKKGTKFKGYYARTFDRSEEIKTGKKYYILQFNAPVQGLIAVELIVKNPYFESKDVAVDGQAFWYVNEKQIGESNFELQIEKEWSNVAVIQTWGTGNSGFWKTGQGRVEIFLNKELVCVKYFILGFSVIYDLEHYDINELEEMEAAGIDQFDDDDGLSVDEILAGLNDFVGLESVKQTMVDFIDYLNFVQERKKIGLKTKGGLSLNSVFLGNPGTGKTSVARVIGDIFKAMKILPSGHLVEVDRATLVGQYVGETAQKTEKVIEEAMGGILFIDEAYTLVKKGGTSQDFGQEAIDTLLKRMEDKSGEFVTIVAGYPEEMNSFLESNPGMKSRFTQYFNFEDYTPDEMCKIFEIMGSKEDYSLSGGAKELLVKEFTTLYRGRDKTFGNARLVRNTYDEAKMRLGKRYLKLPPGMKTPKALTTFEPEDIAAVFKKDSGKDFNPGINEEKLKESLDKLNGLMGLNLVKKEINELVKIARFYSERGENLQNKFSDHIVFLGNPGTGKTTVARIFSDIYSALGILPKGHLVETDRQDLVSGYVGQTATKTTEVIDKAIGGTLFIDEAYSLVSSSGGSGTDFGKEAIDTLLKRMEDDRGKFIVIAAGYTEDMEKFLESNVGLKSRFTKFYLFEDYSPDELVNIAVNILKSKNLKFAPETLPKLKGYFNEQYRKRDETFANARMVRNLVETATKQQLLRLVDIPKDKLTDEISATITTEDITELQPAAVKKSVKIEGDPVQLEKLLKELDSLTGLAEAKKATEKLISSLKVAKLREERGLKVIRKNLHVVFMGNPGTGKTTVARLLSQIYKELGLLEKGHLVEVDRSALVAGYQGQTAQKTEDVIKQALGGTLFIDEAYTLARGTNDFGQEAIDTLLKRMEDYSDRLVVIVAGYPTEMQNFLESNPGLKSRFTNFFVFEDYKPEELIEIAKVQSDKLGYKIEDEALTHLLDVFKELYENRDQNFGNARTVKNILFKAIGNQEERILTLTDLSDEDLVKITLDDVQDLGV